MSTKVEKRIVVDVPVSTAYHQWTQFEEFPRFMGGVESVTRIGNDRLKWVAHIGGVRRHWEARILEQLPGRRVAWTAVEGVTNSGAVDFRDAGNNRTELALTLEYQPAGVVERVGNLLHVVGRQAEHDLKKFKEFIEHQGRAAQAAATVPAEATAPAEQQPYNRFAHPFDQTGGLVDLEGESDETAEGESYSSAERRTRQRKEGNLPPIDGSLGQH
ncbi:MAG TPA: SRPBCC family protein [Arthrobacter sp.]|nr:SRPBCC family protein [Arthrobacter sp.]